MKVFFGIGVRYEGLENIKKGEKFIFFSRHESFIEIFAIAYVIKNMSFIANKTVFNIIKRLMKVFRSISVTRSDRREVFKVAKQAKEVLNDGYSILVFPEASRLAHDEFIKFKAAPAFIAKRAKVRIIPIYTNSGYFLAHKSKMYKSKGNFRVTFGAPISPIDMTISDINTKIENWFKQEYNKKKYYID